MMVSLDGFFEGPNREIDWHNVDAEFNEYAADLLSNVDVLLFGRVTYELMASYWPTEASRADDPIIAKRMNDISKIVFSRTLEKAEWQNTRLVKENISDGIMKAKQQPGKDLAIFGSSDLALTFIKDGLIDEYRIIVNPMLLGGGKQLFHGLKDRVKLKLAKTRNFASGNIMLYYVT